MKRLPRARSKNARRTAPVVACFLAASGLAPIAAPATAEDCDAPCAGYEISIELQNDLTFAATPSSGASNILEPSISAGLFVLPAPGIGLIGTVTTERVEDPAFGEYTGLEGIGSYVEELYVFIEAGVATVRLGKFDPVFSLAGELLPGINATELAGDIDLDERLGGEADFVFEGFGLNHRLTAAAFTADRSALGGAFFAERGQARLGDGGAGNTGGLSSFSAVLSGCAGADPQECYFDGRFGYRVAFRYQKADRVSKEDAEDGATPQDERAWLVGASRNIEFGDRTLGLLGEAAYLANFEGGPDDALFVTGSAAMELGPVLYVATLSEQRNHVANAPDTRDRLVDFEAIYIPGALPFGASNWEIAAAYTYAMNADAEERHILSLRLTIDFFGLL